MELLKKRKLSQSQQKVYHYILERINDGSLMVGSRVPPEMELAKVLEVNRMNVQVTLRYLETHGILFRNKRGGTVVVTKPTPFMLGDLKRNTTKFVSVITPLDSAAERIHWNQTIRDALEKGLQEKGLSLHVVEIPRENDPAAMERYLREWAKSGPVALLFVSHYPLNEMMKDHPEIFFKYHRNVFVFGRDVIDWSFFPYNTVSVDLFNEGVMAAEYAFSHTYNQIFFGIQNFFMHCRWITSRREGLRCGIQRLSDGGLTLEDAILENDLEKVIKEIDSGNKVMIVAANDEIAVHFIDAIASATGKTPGADYGIISFDNNGEYKKYHLTTIAPPLDKIGKTLAKMIASVSGRVSDCTSFIKIKSTLVQGKTC